MLARLIAGFVHEIVSEYRNLAMPARAPAVDEAPPPVLPSVTAASTELASGWDHDKRAPAVAAQAPFGFTASGRQ
jgi:hypothetical protein